MEDKLDGNESRHLTTKKLSTWGRNGQSSKAKMPKRVKSTPTSPRKMSRRLCELHRKSSSF